MAYGTRSGSIRTFWPDDTDTRLYIPASSSSSLQELLERAQAKWGPDIRLDELTISAEHIHTDCLGYDRYDSGDYTDFILLEKTGS